MLSLTARLAWVLIALAIALPVCADDMQDAAKLLKARQHKQALDLVNKVLASKPRDAQARFQYWVKEGSSWKIIYEGAG